SLMIPGGWTVNENGEIVDIQPKANPETGDVKLLFTPTDLIEGGTINGKAVRDLSLQEYASIALKYEIAGAGTLNFQHIDSVMVASGLVGVRAIWEFDYTPLPDSSGATAVATANATPTQTILSAIYFDLNRIVDGKFYRALEISMGSAPLPTEG